MKLLDLKCAEGVTGLSRYTLRYYAHTGKIPAVRGPKNKILFREDVLKQFVESLPPVHTNKENTA